MFLIIFLCETKKNISTRNEDKFHSIAVVSSLDLSLHPLLLCLCIVAILRLLLPLQCFHLFVYVVHRLLPLLSLLP